MAKRKPAPTPRPKLTAEQRERIAVFRKIVVSRYQSKDVKDVRYRALRFWMHALPGHRRSISLDEICYRLGRDRDRVDPKLALWAMLELDIEPFDAGGEIRFRMPGKFRFGSLVEDMFEDEGHVAEVYDTPAEEARRVAGKGRK